MLKVLLSEIILAILNHCLTFSYTAI